MLVHEPKSAIRFRPGAQTRGEGPAPFGARRRRLDLVERSTTVVIVTGEDWVYR